MRWGSALIWTCLALMPSRGSLAQARPNEGREISQAIDELRLEEAQAMLEAALRRFPDNPALRFEHGLLLFHRGEYRAAREELLANAIRAVGLRPASERFLLTRIAAKSAAIFEHFEQQSSPDGRYVVRYPKSEKAILPWLFEVLRRIDKGIGEIFGTVHSGPVQVVLVPSAEILAELSSLSLEEIETTGTIAICKWDHILLTSPRALVHGYPWADTLAHEFVHLVLTRLTRNRAPVWMQEGYARFLERRWRGPHALGELDSYSIDLLLRAYHKNELLSFEQLHPSIARLPSAELAALAFAQVSTFIASFYRRHGALGLQAVVNRVAQGIDAKRAFAEIAQAPFSALEQGWKQDLAALSPPPAPNHPLVLTFRGSTSDDEVERLSQRQARDAVRLGDMLFARRRYLAARYEYERALSKGETYPFIAVRYARAAHAAGTPLAALDVLLPLRAKHPHYAPLFSLIALNALSAGKKDLAEEAALEAIWINPFDPEPPCIIEQIGRGSQWWPIATQSCAHPLESLQRNGIQ
ncbi:MAG: hypothetical protein RMJ84_05965 [Sandaracinaceae bacterium]|nr:hypothetical protein [Sandaracinaceae bacterium]